MGEHDEPCGRHASELEELSRRVDALESQNRRFKRTAAALAVVAASVAVMGLAARAPRTIVAERFVLKNASGRTVGELFADGSGATLRLTSMAGPGGATVSTNEPWPLVNLSSGSNSASLSAGMPGVAGEEMSGAVPSVTLQTRFASGELTSIGMGLHRTKLGGLHVRPLNASAIEMFPDIELGLGFDGQPSLQMSDPNGFEAILGHADLQQLGGAGEQYTRSAASLVFFGNDKGHHVIYEVP